MTLTNPSLTAPLFMTDVYKLGHRDQYPENTTLVYSNFTNRGSRVAGVDKVVHFGLQAFLQSYCIEAFAPFFAADVDEVAAEYHAVVESVLGPDAADSIGVEHIRELHALGYLPLRFSAVKEGTEVPVRVPSLVVENTHPDFFWLTNFIETVLSASLWQPSTSATTALHFRRILDTAAKATGSSARDVDFQLHDFSYRGMPGTEAAAASGAAHLLSFLGSDSLPSLDWIRRYYPGDAGMKMGSVPATEHSVMCAGGQVDEMETFQRLLKLYPSGIVSVVSDTWDLWNVVTVILPKLHAEILGRDGKLVIRPDSGDPVDILTGTRSHEGSYTSIGFTPEEKGVVELLWDLFGGTVNEAGYKVLDPHIGAIYGDSITPERAVQIAQRLEAKGFASTNVVLGVGSFSYQYVTRDTFMSAMKATYVEVDGVGRDIQKNPVTDSGSKKSATGRLAVLRNADGELYLVQKATPEQEAASELRPVWEDGRFIRTQSFADVRATLGVLA